MEKWDVYDMNRQPTNKLQVRGEPILQGNYHVCIHICIFNNQNEMLIQQRTPDKDTWQNRWDFTVGGSILAGETSQQGAMREALEEIGLELDLTSTLPHFTINRHHVFDDFYLLRQEVDLTALKLQPEEVQAVKWADKDEILNLIKVGSFIPFQTSFIHFLFENMAHRGTHQRIPKE